MALNHDGSTINIVLLIIIIIVIIITKHGHRSRVVAGMLLGVSLNLLHFSHA